MLEMLKMVKLLLIENNDLTSFKPFPPTRKLDLVFLNIFILQDQTVYLDGQNCL